MLLPKRTKFRRLHRGRLKGTATKSNTVVFGDFGIQAFVENNIRTQWYGLGAQA